MADSMAVIPFHRVPSKGKSILHSIAACIVRIGGYEI